MDGDFSSSYDEEPDVEEMKRATTRDEDPNYSPFLRPINDKIGDDYKVLDLIESTNECKTYIGVHIKYKFIVTIKLFCKSPKVLRLVNTETESLIITNTIDFQHQYFVKYITRFDFQYSPVLIYQKLGPTLAQQIEYLNGLTFSLNSIRIMIWNIVHAIELLHESHLILGNLSIDTVSMLNGYVDQKGYEMKSGERNLQVRINSLSCVANGNSWHLKTYTPERIQSPEQLLGTRWSYENDIWQLGILFVELLLGRRLFDHNNRLLHLAVIEKLAGPFPFYLLEESPHSYISFFRDGRCDLGQLDAEALQYYESIPELDKIISNEHVLSFIQATLCTDPGRRLLPYQLYEHPFLASF